MSRKSKKEVGVDPLTKAIEADERAYLRFKQYMTGQSKPHLKTSTDWVWRHNLGQPELSRGHAILAAKKVFNGLETGAPRFFEPPRIQSTDVTKDADGWKAEIRFTSDFKKEGGRRIQPDPKDLLSAGFRWVQVPKPTLSKFTFTREVEGTDLKTAVHQVALQLKSATEGLFDGVRNVGLESSDEEAGMWMITLNFEGDLRVDPESPLLADQQIEVVWN